MKLLNFYFILFCFVQLHAQPKTIKTPDSVIPWNASLQLKWIDFEGTANKNLFGRALTSYKIDVIPENVLVDEDDNIQGYERLTVQARFYKKQSWTTTKVNSILAHEQLHFDIAELFARKIRQRFMDLKKGNQRKFSAYWEAYSLFWKQCRIYQKRFDAETNHGRNTNASIIWAERISGELNLLQAFE